MKDFNHKETREIFTWTTQEGIKWKLKDMHDSHIRNCIKHQQRKISYYEQQNVGVTLTDSLKDTIVIFKNEIKYRRKLKLLKILK